MTSPAYQVAQYLEAEGFGSFDASNGSEWRIFVGSEPPESVPSITLYDTGGGQANADGPYYDNTIQVRLRSVGYLEGYDKALAIRDQLLVPTAREIEGWLYTGFWLVSDIAKIGRDDKNRELFTVNFRLMRQPIASV